MLDRTIPPKAESIKSITIPEFNKRNLSNGVPLYFLNSGEQEVLKIDIIVSAGVKYEDVTATAFLVSKLLTAGTDSKTASDIATELDYYGAFTETSSGFDRVSLSVYCLKKFLKPILSLLNSMLTRSVFPQEELDTVIRQKIHSLKISDQKDSEVAAKKFRQNLFGLQHPYGKILKIDDLKTITRNHVTDFYRDKFFNDPVIVVSGKVDEEVLDELSNTFGNIDVSHTGKKEGKIVSFTGNELIERPESVQSAIRMGHLSIGKHHPDIHKLHITTSILGGYFGSRLMSNIREDKGYTYGISASVAHLNEASFLSISTNVVKQYTAHTVEEILKEIRTLQTEPVAEKELSIVTNYLRGKFLSGMDSAFNLADRFKAVTLFGLDNTYYYNFLKELDTITPKEVMKTASEYYKMDEIHSLIVGENL